MLSEISIMLLFSSHTKKDAHDMSVCVNSFMAQQEFSTKNLKKTAEIA